MISKIFIVLLLLGAAAFLFLGFTELNKTYAIDRTNAQNLSLKYTFNTDNMTFEFDGFSILTVTFNGSSAMMNFYNTSFNNMKSFIRDYFVVLEAEQYIPKDNCSQISFFTDPENFEEKKDSETILVANLECN